DGRGRTGPDHPARRTGGDRQEHDGRRVGRRPRADRRRTRVPARRDARRRPRPARLRLPAPERRPDPGRHPHARPRGPRRRAALRRPRGRRAAGLGHAADARPDQVEARRARADQGHGAAPDRARARPGADRPVRGRVRPRDALHPRRRRGRAAHRRGHDPAHRRPQDRPHADRRRADRPGEARPGRRRGRRPDAGRLDERGATRLHAVRGGRGEGAAPDPARRARPRHRHLVRLAHPPSAGGGRRGDRVGAEGLRRRTLHGQEPQHRAEPRLRHRAGRPADQACRALGIAGRGHRDPLHGLPGRAAVGADPHRLRRPPHGVDHPRRHGGPVREAGARQRARGARHHERALARGRTGAAPGDRPGPRLRARLGGRAEDGARARAPGLLHPGPRRDPPSRRPPGARRGDGRAGRPRLRGRERSVLRAAGRRRPPRRERRGGRHLRRRPRHRGRPRCGAARPAAALGGRGPDRRLPALAGLGRGRAAGGHRAGLRPGGRGRGDAARGGARAGRRGARGARGARDEARPVAPPRRARRADPPAVGQAAADPAGRRGAV
ncbi:MAG: Ribonuclease J (endonuclease and 5' exonuclease), partial [uncultured Thermoleophilia bacterium]